jgi:outer membrane protein TolC
MKCKYFKKTTFLLLVSVFPIFQVLPAVEISLPNNEDFQGNTLEIYLERALEANPDLKVFEQKVAAAKERVPQLSALPDPMLQVTHFVESVQTRTGPQENGIMLNQRFPWFGTLKNREVAASAEAEALWYAYQNRQLTLMREVGLSFYEVGYLQKAIAITTENLEWLQQLEPIVETRVKAGGDLNSLLRLKVEIGKLDDRRQSFMNKKIAVSAQLVALLNLPVQNPSPPLEWELPPILELDPVALQKNLLQENPELKMLERKTASAEARVELARLQSYPDFTVGVNYVQIGDPSMNSSAADAGQDAWGVMAAVSLPIWLGKNKAAREEAHANLNASEQEIEQRRLNLISDLESALALHTNAQRQLTLYGEDLISLAEQAVENSLHSYEVGTTSVLELIDSERSLLELQLLNWRAAADALQQRIRIQTLVNQPLK